MNWCTHSGIAYYVSSADERNRFILDDCHYCKKPYERYSQVASVLEPFIATGHKDCVVDAIDDKRLILIASEIRSLNDVIKIKSASGELLKRIGAVAYSKMTLGSCDSLSAFLNLLSSL